MTTTIATRDIDEAMHTWLRDCANPLRIEVVDAVIGGYLTLGVGTPYRYTATARGREWLVTNAMQNGATRAEAVMGLDYIDGA